MRVNSELDELRFT